MSVCCLCLLAACGDEHVGSKSGNTPPETNLYAKEVLTTQSSRIRASWYGDDRDGFVEGFLLSWDGADWYFVRTNDSVFSLKLDSTVQGFTLGIAAVDNSAAELPREGERVPFTDANGNGIFDDGEVFPSLRGAHDPTPARLRYTVKNSAPTLWWGNDSTAESAKAVQLPDTTFTVATFRYTAFDIDGAETISAIQWSLNDSSASAQWQEVPPGRVLLTLTEADGLRPNSDNVLYMRAVDVGGFASSLLRYPAEGSTWYVKKPSGGVLVLRDYSANDESHTFWSTAMRQIRGGALASSFDVLDIRTGRTATSRAQNIPPFLNPMFIQTLKLFKAVILYTDRSPGFDIAAQVLPTYVRDGGKVLWVGGIPSPVDDATNTSLRDFAPVDSAGRVPVVNNPTTIKTGDSVVAVASTIGGKQYPTLFKGGGFVIAQHAIFPQITATPLYKLPASPSWVGTPTVGVRSGDGRFIFLHLPLHFFGGGNSSYSFLETVLFEEFGL